MISLLHSHFRRLVTLSGLIGVALLCFPCGQSASAAPQPNILIFLADDSGWGDYSFNGNTNIRTPNIDSIARNGAVLDRFYVCPVCAPTRAEFLTGRYHPRGGVRGVSTGLERLNTEEKTIADAFKAAGYATGAFGKWHNGSQWPFHPNARGFDEYYGFASGHWGEYFDPPLEHNGKLVRGKGFIADDLTDHALGFIEKNKAKPFFCYVPYNTPHSPWAVPQEYWQRFKNDSVKLRANAGNPEELDQTRCALAMVENLDWNVGRVLQRLDKLKLADNTIVIYFSDNGPNSWRWNGAMKGRKGTTDEGGGELNSALLNAGLVNEVHLTVCPNIFGGRDAPTIADGLGAATLADATEFQFKSMRPIGDEMFLVYRATQKRAHNPAPPDVIPFICVYSCPFVVNP